MAAIFVSYRREDTRDFTGRVCDRLRNRFGQASVFVAPEDIPIGQPFEKVLLERLDECRVLLAIIGKQWLAETNQAGSPRPSDYVQLELATALQRGIPTVPIRVDGAPVPTNLPGPLAELAGRQWLWIDSENFHSGADHLIERLEKNYFPSVGKKWGLVSAQVFLVAVGAAILIPAPRTWIQGLNAAVAVGLAVLLYYSPNWGWRWRR